MIVTYAVTTQATVEAGTPVCEGCLADAVGTEIGAGVFLVEIHHEPGCPKPLPTYDKP